MRVTQMPAVTKERRQQRSQNISGVEIRSEASGRNSLDIGKLLSRFQKDDYILAGLILVLVLEGCDDYILLAALGYLFVMGL